VGFRGGWGFLHVGRLGSFGLRGILVQKIEMVDQAKSLDGEALGNVGIVHGDQVVAVIVFTTVGEVGRPEVDDGIRSINPTDNELMCT